MHNLAYTLGGMRRHEEAENLYREVFEIRGRVLGPEHPGTLDSMEGLAAKILDQGRYLEAEKLCREVLELRERGFGPEHRDTLNSMNSVAVTVLKQGRYPEAEKLLREILEIRRRTQGSEHPDTAMIGTNLAAVYTNWCWKLATAADAAERDPPKAVELANLALELRPDDANHWNNLGVAQYRAGNCKAAVEALEKADAMLQGGDRAHRMFLGMSYWLLGDKEKARERYAQGAAWIASQAQNNEEANRFRAEAEELMEISQEERKRLIEEYQARPAEKKTGVPKEP